MRNESKPAAIFLARSKSGCKSALSLCTGPRICLTMSSESLRCATRECRAIQRSRAGDQSVVFGDVVGVAAYILELRTIFPPDRGPRCRKSGPGFPREPIDVKRERGAISIPELVSRTSAPALLVGFSSGSRRRGCIADSEWDSPGWFQVYKIKRSFRSGKLLRWIELQRLNHVAARASRSLCIMSRTRASAVP